MDDKLIARLLMAFILFMSALFFLRLLSVASESPLIFSDSTHYVAYSIQMSSCLKGFYFFDYAKLAGIFFKSTAYVSYLSLFFTFIGVSVFKARIASLALFPIFLILFYMSLNISIKNRLLSLLGLCIILGTKVILNFSFRPDPFMISLVAGTASLVAFQLFLLKKTELHALALSGMMIVLLLTRLHVFIPVVAGIFVTNAYLLWRKEISVRLFLIALAPAAIFLALYGYLGFFRFVIYYGTSNMDLCGDRWSFYNLSYYPFSVCNEYISFKLLALPLFAFLVFCLICELKKPYVLFLSTSILCASLLLTYHTLKTHEVFAFCYIEIILLALIGLDSASSRLKKSFSCVLAATFIFALVNAYNAYCLIRPAGPAVISRLLNDCQAFQEQHKDEKIYFMGSTGWLYFNQLNLKDIIGSSQKPYHDLIAINEVSPFFLMQKSARDQFLIRIEYCPGSPAIVNSYGEHVGGIPPQSMHDMRKEAELFNKIGKSALLLESVDYPEAGVKASFYRISPSGNLDQ